MKDSQTSANIKFLKREDPPAPDGSRLAETRWVYDVDGQPVWVVTDKYLMHDWEVTELQIIEAGRACIRDKIDNEEVDEDEDEPSAEEEGIKDSKN